MLPAEALQRCIMASVAKEGQSDDASGEVRFVRQYDKRPQGGLAEKRAAILEGGLKAFAQHGYTRATIDSIAFRSGVSTRTIYNHFCDKEHLFQEVIQFSAERVAQAYLAIIDRYLRKVTDLEDDFLDLGRAWVEPMPEYADHDALVRQILAEAAHIPVAAIRAWQEAGPLRVRRALAAALRRLAELGWLHVDDPESAALHFTLLVSAGQHPHRQIAPLENRTIDLVAAGIRAFLYGYAR